MELLDQILDALTMHGAHDSVVMERVRYFKRAEDLAAQAVNFRSERDNLSARLSAVRGVLGRIADRVESGTEGVEDGVNRLATAFNDAKMRIVELEAELSFEQLTSAHYGADLVTIVQLCGGDVEDGPSAARECVERLVAQAKAPHVRDTRRLKLRKGWSEKWDELLAIDNVTEIGQHFCWLRDRDEAAYIVFCPARNVYTACHDDGSETDHATRIEAHDALIESGSESPFETVTGVVAKAAVAE